MRSKVEFISEDLEFTDMTDSDQFTQNTAWGVAVSGVMIYNGISGEGQDPFYPAEGESEKIDSCLSHPAPIGNTLHYHGAGTCVGDEDWELVSSAVDIKESMQESWLVRPYREVFGLSFDGRPIYSPYYSNGIAYSDCEVDVCNGIEIDG